MNKLLKISINIVKRLLLFLEKKWYKNQPINDSPINSLAPKVLTDEKDVKAIQPYLDRLMQAIDAKDIYNIAITGAYGSGKSTILKTFQHQYEGKKYEFLNISLASFKDNKESKEKKEGADDELDFERKLEISILQQIFYHVEPSKIPDSRFKRIVNLTNSRLFVITFFVILWILSALVLLKFDYINMLNPQKWKLSSPLNWTATISSFVFFMGIGVFIQNLYRLFSNSKISKLTIQGELELGESIDTSVFNQHLEEILYFFERTDVNVVVIEDIDRFDSTDIFTKLREVNFLINNANQIKQPVKFIYAIKDEMFKDKSERVKFFEFIIPVIPFINPSNASDQLTKLIEDAKLQDALSADFTSDVVTFIDDIDMRLLINIFDEYQLYRSIQGSDLKQDNLFAIIVYKNLYPDDFGDLQKRKGNLYEFFAKKTDYISAISTEHNKRIQDLDKQIELIENESEKSVKELRAIYINTIVGQLDGFLSFIIEGTSINIQDALNDTHFNQIVAGKNITTYRYYDSRYGGFQNKPYNIRFSDIEKKVANTLTYAERHKRVIDRINNRHEKLKTERDRLNKGIREIELMSIQELFEDGNLEEYMGVFKDNNLMRNLLLNGYIDEHYDDYISLFHEVNLTKEDYIFEQSIKSRKILSFEHSITKIENLIKRLPDKYFRKVGILNYKLLTFLLENEAKYNTQFEYFFKVLSVDDESQFKFIQGFINSEPNKITAFINKLCAYKPTLWQYIDEKSGLPEADKRVLLKHIFNYADEGVLLKFSLLDKYVADMNDFFSFCTSLEQTTTIESFVTKKMILFSSLDVPTDAQKQLFEAIYTKNLYKINRHNILSIIKGNGKGVDEDKLNLAHYTTLLNLNLKDLLNYIDNNIKSYIEQVILSGNENKEEEEKAIIIILNREDVSLDLKNQLVNSQNTKISHIDAVNDIEVKQVILHNNKLMANWRNIFDYYDTIGNHEFDDALISFLNQEENYTILAKHGLDDQERGDEYIETFSDILIRCEELDIHAYDNLMDSLPHSYTHSNLKNLHEDRIRVLLSKRLLDLNNDNFNELKLKGNNLQIRLIEIFQNDFVKNIDKFGLDSDDYLHILQSSSIINANKIDFVQQLNESYIIHYEKIAKEVGAILPEDKPIELKYRVLYAIFNTSISISKKIILLNFNFVTLNESQIQTLIEKLGGNYEKIFIKQSKPTFTNTPYHTNLFEKLKAKDLIIRYELLETKNNIRVFAKY